MGERLPREGPKPLGSELWFAHTDQNAGKILRVRAGCRLSVQFHEEKDETSFVLFGRVIVSQGDSPDALTAQELGPGDSWRSSPRVVHTFEAVETQRSSRSRRRSLTTSFVWRTDMAAWVTPRRGSADRLSHPPPAEARGRPAGNGTAPSRFGHFCAEVPKSLHIRAYPHAFHSGAAGRRLGNPLQVATFAARGSRRPT